MAADKTLSWTYVESFLPVSQVIDEAAARGAELGCPGVSPATGAALRMVAATLGAKSVLEIGTGVGVSSLWCLSGMAADGVLTSIDVEAEFQQAARAALNQAGVPSTRARLITGRALTVLPRMAGGAYDMVVVDAGAEDCAEYIAQAERILRPGGALALVHALWRDHVADPARREADVVAMRQAVQGLRENEAWVVNLLGVGDGLLVAVKR